MSAGASRDGSEPPIERKVFNAGLKRKRIEFVPAGEPSTGTASSVAPRLSLEERYLSITLKDEANPASKTGIAVTSAQAEPHEAETKSQPVEGAKCRICKWPIDAKTIGDAATPLQHEASLAHQVCLEHSYPPSHLDRHRHGLKYLSSYGWDPDGRLGLGVSGAGIRVPIKAKGKNDTVGLGMKVPELDQSVGKGEKLGAKGLRKREKGEKVKRERLQRMFYANDDINKYLGVV